VDELNWQAERFEEYRGHLRAVPIPRSPSTHGLPCGDSLGPRSITAKVTSPNFRLSSSSTDTSGKTHVGHSSPNVAMPERGWTRRCRRDAIGLTRRP
jgi:hypothetical protein